MREDYVELSPDDEGPLLQRLAHEAIGKLAQVMAEGTSKQESAAVLLEKLGVEGRFFRSPFALTSDLLPVALVWCE
jgi:hypothetical protein